VTVIFAYMLEGDEFVVLLGSAGAAIYGLIRLSFPRMPALYFRHNMSGVGLARLAIVLGLCWIAYVLWNHADPSVVDIYRVFYLVMGLAVVVWCGPVAARAAGARFQQDVIERRNPRAALIVAVMILATGLIFGGSLWGEADPVGDDEGGWWIPVGFFVAGWLCLIVAVGLYTWRDSGGSLSRLRQQRQLRDALGPALYMLSSAAILTESVAGDFHGWGHGLTAVGAIGGMLISRELMGGITGKMNPDHPARTLEPVIYIVWGAGFWWVTRTFLGTP
jgi:hypothetical protein